ncbi:galactokinase [Mariniflexile fucanivorans]|uniref:Galactokinase n=1 Tax=Mariniflexile fucanivorans TaxID=264023 RepID=A0A4V2QD80_9FLAO|nr:galactokinase [Mariniflexile fucanivorans]TCL62867.1 galactokinase [Mariniflexile fucanivorans]
MSTALINTIKNSFFSKFQKEPILIFSPGRINIIGEHTDYNDGFVFPAAVDKGIVAGIQKSDTNTSIAYAADKDESIEFSLDKLKPLAQGSWQNYILGVVAEIQNRSKTLGNFNIAFGGDIPGGAGMSSSAALENSVVFGLNELFDLGLTKHEMILISQKAEHNYVGVKCGIMDQYASMFGIENHALLLDCRTVKSKPFEIDFKDHELILINTNVKHSLSDSAYNDRRSVCESVAEMLNVKALRDATEFDLESIKDRITPENYQKVLYVIQENERAVRASKAMQEDDLETLGELIYASHNGLQNQYKVSCDELDFLVEQAKLNGHVLGARMMGGGFGGCTINLIEKAETESFKMFVSEAYKNEFNKECSIYDVKLSDGTHLIK